jgi:molybdenum cofactor cytidylyltransferase
MPDFRCAAVILAAGASTRLGQPKQLVRINGESLLRRTARLALEAGCSPVHVVLGYEGERMCPELADLTINANQSVHIVVNQNWNEGMGASLRSGMEALRNQQPHPDAVLVLVCDQPPLTADHLRELLTQHATAGHKPAAGGSSETNASSRTITASLYAGRFGVPAVFSARLFPALLASQGDRGARDLIRAHAAEVQAIPWPPGELDLDSPEDLTAIER